MIKRVTHFALCFLFCVSIKPLHATESFAVLLGIAAALTPQPETATHNKPLFNKPYPPNRRYNSWKRTQKRPIIPRNKLPNRK